MSNVKLIIYNVMGQEVSTLVNENKTAGSYKVEFDGTNLPSGLYFYKFVSGNFSDTKRMILLK
ncbi:MAG: T9SS type A sorting domain-containing protein [Bacteroidota bacterium]|nr:T9SS type A sorting domain-containing protein [Bacteroidota bacterium]